MKLSRFVWMFWLGNLALLVAVAAFMWHEGTATQAERDSRDAAIEGIDTDEPRIEWPDENEVPPFHVIDTRLSPIARPAKPQPVVEKPAPLPPREKTDDELRDELEQALNKRFKLLRMMVSSSEEYPDIALVVADTARMQWFEGMNLKDEYAKAKSAALRNLAYDLTVLTIDSQGVLVDAASLEKPDKRFEILLKVSEDPLSFTMLSAHFQPDGEALKPGAKKDDDILDRGFQPQDEPPRPEKRDIDKEDFSEEALEDLVKYTKAGENGVEILPELPEDSPARKYGAQGGEIVKTINGESVKNMSDVRRVVRALYDGGTREFTVGYERDGVPGERTFKAPETK
jgi:hypothetical protein